MANSSPVATWSTRALAPAKQFAAWREVVSETHLAWDLPARRDPMFRARIQAQALAASSIVECVCDPCSGRRGSAEIARSHPAQYGLLYLLAGRELIRQAGREAWLAAGDFVLWDSTRPIDFAIDGTLHKITLLVPQPLLEALLPNAHDLVATRRSARSGCGALLGSHLRALARERLHGNGMPRLLTGTLDLLACALAPEEAPASSRQEALCARIRTFILERLHEPELSPARIAAAHAISVRQLHRLFESTGATVERWIWQQRLQRCHHELITQRDCNVSQIAFRWGFNDAAHFSRAFKARFGISPRALRSAAFSAQPARAGAPAATPAP
jgi:AraC-like DNA-binding protein